MQRHQYLLHPDVRRPDEMKFREFLKASAPLPPSMDYRAVMPPIWDQGNLGACQSYAIDAVDQFIKQYAYTPSHIFTYYNVRLLEGTVEQDAGGTLSGTCRAVQQYGICNADVWPNDNSQFNVKPSEAAYADGLAGNDRIYRFYRAFSVYEARAALASGHLPYIGITIHENFDTDKTMQTGIIPYPKGSVLGGHAMVLVGYYDAPKPANPLCRLCCWKSRGYFIVRNSWGTGIGLDGSGYFQMDYSVFEKLLMDMWIIIG